MRYRSFSQAGGVSSAVSVVLPDTSLREADRIKLVHAALESGINTFEIQSANPEVALALAKALETVDRRLVNVGLRMTWSAEAAQGRPAGTAAIASQIEITTDRTGLKWLDWATIDAPDAEPPPQDAVVAMQAAKSAGRVRRLGIGGEGQAVQGHIQSGAFDILAMSFNVHSGWAARNRIKDASAREMAVIAYDRYPSRQSTELPAVLARAGGVLGRMLTGRPADESRPSGSGYAFMNETRGWNADQICLAYALTEPAISTIQVDPHDIDSLQGLAAVTELELPSGLAAQIEMARFSNLETERPVDNQRRRA